MQSPGTGQPCMVVADTRLASRVGCGGAQWKGVRVPSSLESHVEVVVPMHRDPKVRIRVVHLALCCILTTAASLLRRCSVTPSFRAARTSRARSPRPWLTCPALLLLHPRRRPWHRPSPKACKRWAPDGKFIVVIDSVIIAHTPPQAVGSERVSANQYRSLALRHWGQFMARLDEKKVLEYSMCRGGGTDSIAC